MMLVGPGLVVTDVGWSWAGFPWSYLSLRLVFLVVHCP